MSSPQIFHSLPFLVNSQPHPDLSRSPSASGATTNANFGGVHSSPMTNDSSVASSCASAGSHHADHGYDPVIPGHFDGIPSPPPGGTADVATNRDSPSSSVALQNAIKQEDNQIASLLGGTTTHLPFAPLTSSEPVRIPGFHPQTKWGYQTSDTRASLAPPSGPRFGDSDNEQHPSNKDTYTGSVESAYGNLHQNGTDQAGMQQDRHRPLPPQIQVQIGGGANRPSHQPTNAQTHSLTVPYGDMFNSRVRPSPQQFASPSQHNLVQSDQQQQQLQFSPGPAPNRSSERPIPSYQMDHRSVPPLSSSSSTTATTPASFRTTNFSLGAHEHKMGMAPSGPRSSSFNGNSPLPSYNPQNVLNNGKDAGHTEPQVYGHSLPFSFGSGGVSGWRGIAVMDTPTTGTPTSAWSANPSLRQASSTPQPISQQQDISPFGYAIPQTWHSALAIVEEQPQQQPTHWRTPPTPEQDTGSASLMPKGFQKSPRKHVCRICDKRFNRPSSLQTHMSVHTGAKPYQCPKNDCARRFSVSSNLRRHMRTHDAKAKKDAKHGASMPGNYEDEQDDEQVEDYQHEDSVMSGVQAERHSLPAYPYYPQQAMTQPGQQQQQMQVIGSGSFFYTQPGVSMTTSTPPHHGANIYSQKAAGDVFSSPTPSRQMSNGNRAQHSLMLGPSIPQGFPVTPTVVSPYSNKQHGVRHGPSIFGYSNSSPSQEGQGRVQS